MIFNEDSTKANSPSSAQTPKDNWLPDLYVDLCALAEERWDPSIQEPFPMHRCKTPGWRDQFNLWDSMSVLATLTPMSGSVLAEVWGMPTGPKWGCESTEWTSWSLPVTGDLITVQWAGDMKNLLCRQQTS